MAHRIGRPVALGALWALILTSGVAQSQAALQVRVTYYLDSGTTYTGTQTRPGVAACSWGFPSGTRLRFVTDGREVVCEDRGQLGAGQGWVDVWHPTPEAGRQMVRTYGDYTRVEVIP